MNRGKRIQSGYWLFHRFYLDEVMGMKPELVKLWLLCMNRANWEANEINLDGLVEPVKLLPGQFITSRENLHAEYHAYRKGYKKRHPSAWTLWQWLSNKLAGKYKLLSIKSTNKYSIITMANWPSEQTNWQKVSSNLSNKTPKTEHREEYNKKIKEGESKSTTKICSACKSEFVPRIAWHTTCDNCYRTRNEKSGARPELLAKKCLRCGYEASNVVNGLCPVCEDKQMIQ